MPPGLGNWRVQREHDGSEPAPTCSEGSVAFGADVWNSLMLKITWCNPNTLEGGENFGGEGLAL
jgi:hypothetical protein